MQITYENVTEHYSEQIKIILSCKSYFYRTFSIPKKSGGKRVISEPNSKLKEIQRALCREIFYPKSYLIHKCAFAYVPHKQMRGCIDVHENKAVVMKADIKNFFGSVTEKHITDSFLYAFRMEEETAKIITELCTLNGVLPQGAVTSPILSNFVCRILDRRIYDYCQKHNIEYTRYADDMIFSGDFDTDALARYLVWALRDYYGFKLNYDKLKIMKKHQRQIVLGVLVNDKCRLTKEKRRELRQILYYAKKYGAEDCLACAGYDDESLIGYINYAIDINDEPCLTELKNLLVDYRRKNI